MDEQAHPTPDQAAASWAEFGAWLQRTYLALGMNRKDLERAAQVQYSTLQRLEDGGRRDGQAWLLPNPSDTTLERLAKALRVDVEDVYKRVGGRQRQREADTGRPPRWPRRQRELEERITELEAQLAQVMARLAEDDRVEPEPDRDQRAG